MLDGGDVFHGGRRRLPWGVEVLVQQSIHARSGLSGIGPLLVLTDLAAVLATGLLVDRGLWPVALGTAALGLALVARSLGLYQSRLVLSVLEDLPALLVTTLTAGLLVLGLGLEPAAPRGDAIARAAVFTASGAAKSGNPCERLTAPCSSDKRVISRMTDSVNWAAFCDPPRLDIGVIIRAHRRDTAGIPHGPAFTLACKYLKQKGLYAIRVSGAFFASSEAPRQTVPTRVEE